jgi:hypothetical protein
MAEPIWIEMKPGIYWRQHEDGSQESCTADHPPFQAWLSEGNTPLPAPEPEPAPVLTTEQKLEAAGLTVAELKELFNLT